MVSDSSSSLQNVLRPVGREAHAYILWTTADVSSLLTVLRCSHKPQKPYNLFLPPPPALAFLSFTWEAPQRGKFYVQKTDFEKEYLSHLASTCFTIQQFSYRLCPLQRGCLWKEADVMCFSSFTKCCLLCPENPPLKDPSCSSEVICHCLPMISYLPLMVYPCFIQQIVHPWCSRSKLVHTACLFIVSSSHAKAQTLTYRP